MGFGVEGSDVGGQASGDEDASAVAPGVMPSGIFPGFEGVREAYSRVEDETVVEERVPDKKTWRERFLKND